MALKKLLLTCPAMVPDQCLARLGEMFEVKVSSCSLSEDQLIKAAKGADLVVIGGGEIWTKKALKAAKEGVRAIFLGVQPETSFTEEALAFLGKENLFVTGGGYDAVALTTHEQIINPFFRKTLISQRAKQFIWTPAVEIAQELRPLSGLEVSVIGAGNIGVKVLRMLSGKCKLLKYHDLFGKRKDLADSEAAFESDLVKAFNADIVAIHLKLVEQTRGLIGYKHLSRIKHGGWLINPSRAQIVNAEEFLFWLKEGGKAIWDVFYAEGKNFEDLLLKGDVYSQIARMPNFYFTSHTAAMSPETFAEYGEGLLRVIAENRFNQ